MSSSFRNAAVHERLMEVEQRLAARQKLIQCFEWFVHDTPKENFRSIRRYGIKRTDDGAIYTPISIERRYGRLPPTVCLAPGPEGWASTISKPGPFARFAMRSTKLPHDIGLDWTNPYNWNLAAVIADDAPDKPIADLFTEVIDRSRVLVSYTGIRAKWLRVLTRDAPSEDPSKWPSVWNIDANRVADAA